MNTGLQEIRDKFTLSNFTGEQNTNGTLMFSKNQQERYEVVKLHIHVRKRFKKNFKKWKNRTKTGTTFK